MALRSGRFIFGGQGIAQTDRKLMVGNKPNSALRILNSGVNAFIINPGGLNYTLYPQFSFDLYSGRSEVTIRATANQEVEGIYDYISQFQEIRSGRFDTRLIRGAAADPDGFLQIADLASKDDTIYRFFNAGDSKISVFAARGSGTATINQNDPTAIVYPNHSVDVEIESKNDRTIFVKTHTSEPADTPIIGSYDVINIG